MEQLTAGITILVQLQQELIQVIAQTFMVFTKAVQVLQQ